MRVPRARPLLPEGGADTLDALVDGPVVRRRRRQVGQAPVPEAEQVLGRQPSAAGVVGEHGRHGGDRRLAVDDDDRAGHLADAHLVPQREGRAGDDEAIHLALGEHLERLDLALRIAAAVREQDGVAALAGGVLDGAHDLREVGVLDVGDDEADGAGRAQPQRAGHARGSVAEGAGCLLDPLRAWRGSTLACPRRARLTVAMETPARAATSRTVAGLPDAHPRRPSLAGRTGLDGRPIVS